MLWDHLYVADATYVTPLCTINSMGRVYILPYNSDMYFKEEETKSFIFTLTFSILMFFLPGVCQPKGLHLTFLEVQVS